MALILPFRNPLTSDQTLDTFFGGSLRVLQKKRGYRFSVDAVLLSQFSKIRKNEKVMVMFDTVQESELFRGVSQRAMTEIGNGSEEVAFGTGTIIFRSGEGARYVYEIIEGGVDIIMLEKEIVHLTASRNGQIFGWSALVEPYVYTATARCTADTRVLKISRDSIEEAMEKHPSEATAILRNLTRIIAQRLRLAYAYIHYYCA